MTGIWLRWAALSLVTAGMAFPHAAPVPAPKPPFRVQGATLVDAARTPFVLSSATMPVLGMEAENEAPAIVPLTFRILRQRWNLNAVRLPVSAALFARHGAAYLDRVEAAVAMAAAEELVVDVVVTDAEAGQPDASTLAFWTALGGRLREQPRVVFSLFGYPRGGAVGSDRRAAWLAWRDGGDGLVGMQQLIDAVRSTGATQVISAPALGDGLGFREFAAAVRPRGENLMYEAVVPLAMTDAEREAALGALTAEAPVMAADWGAPTAEECGAALATAADLTAAVYQTLAYTLLRSLSWSAGTFAPGSLIGEDGALTATDLAPDWTCGEAGIGRLVLLWQTGDPYGFGSLAADQIASAAGGPAGPIVPGQIVHLYGQVVGPEDEANAAVDEQGMLPVRLAEAEVLVDGVAVPVLTASYFFVRFQTPYEVAGRDRVTVQLVYRGVPSNVVTVGVTDVSPAVYARFGSISDAAAVNETGAANGTGSPASVGSVVRVTATGMGMVRPARATGQVAREPLGRPVAAVTARMGGLDAEVVSVEEAGGVAGVMAVRVRVPAVAGTGVRATPVVLEVGGRRNAADVRVWVQ